MDKKLKHGGKRKGAGRKPAPEPVFTKKFRASEYEQLKFKLFMTGDARKDFVFIIRAIQCLTTQEAENKNDR